MKTGLLQEAKRFFFYGARGVGKSTLAADAGAIVMDIEGGTGALDVPRYPFHDGSDGHLPRSLDDVYAGIDDLRDTAHDYKALALDTTDSIEALIWRHVCEHAGIKKSGEKIETIEDFGYGKGYNVAADEWRKLLHRLDELRLKRGMHIILIGHALVKPFKNPIGDDYDRYRPKLDDRASGLVQDWCEVVGFVAFDDVASKRTSADRARGVSLGSRVVRLEHHAAWDAKCRLPMLAEVPLSIDAPWAPFAAALDALHGRSPKELRALIDAELDRLGAEFTKPDGSKATADAVRAAVKNAGDDVATLSRHLTRLQQTPNQEQQS